MADAYVQLPTTTNPYWGIAVADFASLPAAGDIQGQVRLVLDTDSLYEWNGAAWQLIVAGGADVTGPGSSTDDAVVRFSGTTGKVLQNSVVVIGDTGNVTGIVDLTVTGATTLATSLSGPLRASSGVVATGQTNLATEVTGVLPIANGGTNSAAALNNNRIVVSSGSAIVEAAAITASRALESNGSGIPVASAVTSTELGFVSGVTSSIQTQLNAKVDEVASTDEAVVRFDGTGGAVQNSGVIIDNNDDMTLPGLLNMTGGAGTYLRVPQLTTVQRDALTPAAGMILYNTTAHTLQAYVAGTVNNWVDMLGWGAPTG